jgi:hypothetical protein
MKLICSLALCGIAIGAELVSAQSVFHPNVPKTWDEAKLTDWATPLAGINVRPTHISAKEYYSCDSDSKNCPLASSADSIRLKQRRKFGISDGRAVDLLIGSARGEQP